MGFNLGVKGLTVCKTNEYMYWGYSVIISIFLKASLQESLGPVFVIILTRQGEAVLHNVIYKFPNFFFAVY